MEAELLHLLGLRFSYSSFFYYSCVLFPDASPSFHPFFPAPERHEEGVLKCFLALLSLSPARSRWGRNLIRGKYHQTWWRWRLPRLPPVVCCLGSSRADRCKLILWSATPILVCQRGCEVSREKFIAHIEEAWRLYSTPLQSIGWKVSVTNLTPPDLLCLQLKYTMYIFMRNNLKERNVANSKLSQGDKQQTCR